MYKRVLVLMGWLVLFLLVASIAWGAATKDGKPIKRQVQPRATISGTSTSIDLQKFREANSGLRYITFEQRMEGLRKAKQAESSSSVYEAAAGIISESPFFTPGVLTELAPQNYDTAGFSYYDYNANYRNPRMIAFVPTNRNVGVSWGKIPNNVAPGQRNVFCTLWKNSSKTGGNFLPNIALDADLQGRGGFSGATYLPKTGRLVLYAHHAEDPQGVWFGAENTAGLFDWGTNIEAPDSIAGVSTTGSWPTAAGGLIPDNITDYDNNPTTETLEVIHFFSYPNGPTPLIYGRVVDSAGVWIYPGFANKIGYIVDSSEYITPTVVASKKSAKVALMYTSEDQCGGTKGCSDIIYIESTNGGNDWVTAGNFASVTKNNITNYGVNDRVRAAPDLMGVYDSNDSLVISFLQFVDYDPSSGNESVQADAMVWAKAFGVRKAVDGNFPIDNLQDDTRRQTVNWPHLAVNDVIADTLYGYLYLVWTQFSGPDSAAQADTNLEGYINGDVYIAASTNNGKTWSAPINATNSHTPACSVTAPNSGVGTCSGVNYSSCAERANDTIHIFYMSDEYAGYWTAGSGENGAPLATANEVIYMKYPAYKPPASKRISTTPGLLIVNPGGPGPSLSLALNPDFTITDTFYVQNIGNDNLTVDSITKGQSWLTINNGVAGFPIIEGDPDVAIGVTANDASLANGVYYDTILVYNNSVNKPIAVVPVYMIVDNGDPFYTVQFDSLVNNNVKVSVSNVSNLGNQSTSLGFYRIAGTDTTNNLFDGTSFLAVKTASPYNDSLAGRFMFGKVLMQPMSNLTVGDTTIGGGGMPITGTSVTLPAGTYHRAGYSYSVFYPDANNIPYPGPWFGFLVQERLFLPKPNGTYLYKVSNVKLTTPPSWWTKPFAFDSTVATGEDVYYGIGSDWDAYITPPNHNLATSVDNYGMAAAGTGVAWQQGAKESASFPSDSTLERNGHFGYIAFMAPAATPDPYSMHVVSNPFGLYPGGGYEDDILYTMAADAAADTGDANPAVAGVQFKYFLPDTASHDSIPTDLNIVFTLGKLSPPYAEKNFVAVLGVVAPPDTVSLAAAPLAQTGCDALAKAIRNIRTAVGLDSIADLKSKLKCTGTSCLAKPGDANASGNYTLGDVISIVNYVFNKPGCSPQPLCWLSNLLCRGDWNASGNVTLSDVIQAVNFVFNKPGGPWNAQPVGVCCLP